MAKYPYKPLSLPAETRILTVSPGKPGDALVCSLSHITLASSNEQYDALSYCWSMSIGNAHTVDDSLAIMCAAYGKDEDGAIIQDSASIPFKDLYDHPYYGHSYIRMGGRIPDGTLICDGIALTIGGELVKALSQLRKLDEPLRIWIDALCINQDDIPERNEHVRMMGDIYARASLVRVWLGEEIGIEMGAMETLKGISEALNDLIVERKMLEDGASLSEIQWHFFNTANTRNLEWDRLAEFLGRAWVCKSPPFIITKRNLTGQLTSSSGPGSSKKSPRQKKPSFISAAWNSAGISWLR